jgi:hypothetical protein
MLSSAKGRISKEVADFLLGKSIKIQNNLKS